MIAFACCIASREKYEKFALPGIKRFGGPDALIIETSSDRSILEAYNGVLDQLRHRNDIEALVLLHEDTEIRDPLFRWRMSRAFNDPDVAVVGAIGASNVTSLAWWEGHTFGHILESRGHIEFGGGSADVDAVDGGRAEALRDARLERRRHGDGGPVDAPDAQRQGEGRERTEAPRPRHGESRSFRRFAHRPAFPQKVRLPFARRQSARRTIDAPRPRRTDALEFTRSPTRDGQNSALRSLQRARSSTRVATCAPRAPAAARCRAGAIRRAT